jgi:hypothetical protein
LTDNPESIGSKNSCYKINDWTKLSYLRFSKKSQGLETSQNSKKEDKCFQSSRHKSARMGSSLFWILTMCKHMLIPQINISYNNSWPCWVITEANYKMYESDICFYFHSYA